MIRSPLATLVGVSLILVLVACASETDGGDAASEGLLTGTDTIAPAAVTKTPSGSSGDAGFSAEDPMSMPERAGPTGLSTIGLPHDRGTIIGLFNRLPERLLGRTRGDEIRSPLPDRINASYGKTEPMGCGMVGLQAADVSSGDFYPTGWTAERVIALFASGSDWTVGRFGRAGELFWVNMNTTCSFGSSLKDSLEITTWGVSGSPWVFSATAQDAKGRDELVAAFVEASG